jgi:hypothetical protein
MELDLTISKLILLSILLVFSMGIGCLFALDFQILQGLVF